jgi:probable non-F420 flavinoid oxidoreductase
MSSTAAIGYHGSHEQHPPSALLRYATLAARAGFEHAMCSDHFQPWSERQGHSGFTWSWLGAVMQATPLTFGTVCAPGQRYHPAIIAQAAATLAEMYGDRFWIAVGSGEALNEAITAEGWPTKAERNARLQECVDLMRALWNGETVTYDGFVRVRDAKLHVRPVKPPMIVGAALSVETARWLGGWADAMITVATDDRTSMRAVLEAFRDGGGAGKPAFLQVALSYAPTDVEARQAAHDQWRQAALSGEALADLRTPAEFDRATVHVTEDEIARLLRVSADIRRHIGWLEEDAAMGFDRLYLHNVARQHEERFIDACAAHVLPHFTAARAAAR